MQPSKQPSYISLIALVFYIVDARTKIEANRSASGGQSIMSFIYVCFEKMHLLLLRHYDSGFSNRIAGHGDFCRYTETAGYLMMFFLHWLMYQYDKITKLKKPEAAPLYALISPYRLGMF